jgi:hypothetical protein
MRRRDGNLSLKAHARRFEKCHANFGPKFLIVSVKVWKNNKKIFFTISSSINKKLFANVNVFKKSKAFRY